MAKASSASKRGRSSSSRNPNRNYSTNLADGRSVSVRNGVKTYSNGPLQVKGNNGISISGKSYSKDQGGTGFKDGAITSADLAPTEKINLAPPAVPTVPDIASNNVGFTDPVTGVTSGANGMLTVTPPTTDKYAGATQLQNDFQAALNSLNSEATSAADIQRQLEKETDLKDKQQAVNDYTAQLNTIVANRDANILRVEGQGRGIPEAIIGGQQAQINKEAAIAALPVQAQLAAAQGNLQLAQDHINTWGNILMKDAEQQYTRKKEVLLSVRDFAMGIEFKRIDDLEKANERKYQEAQALTSAKTAALSQALGQNAPASIMNAIKSATTAEEVVAAAGIYNGDVLGNKIKQKQLADMYAPKGGGSDVPTIKTINGVDYQWNAETGTWEIPLAGGMPTGASGKNDLIDSTIALGNELLSSTTPGKSSAIGASFAKLVPFGKQSGLQGNRVAFEEKLNTFKASLSLDNLKMLKGPMSDKDLAFIQSVSSSLNPDMSEASFNTEVTKIVTKLAKSQEVAQPVKWGVPVLGANETIAPVQAPNGAVIIITD